MTGNAQRQFWSMHQIAGLLAGLGSQALVSTILAPTTTARLASLVASADGAPEIVRIDPDWVYSSTKDGRSNELVAVGRQQLCDHCEGLIADTDGADRYIINQPLSALFTVGQDPLRHRRVLPVVEALDAYRSSSALVLGSGSAGLALLRSCTDRSDRLPDIVIFDLSPVAWLQPGPPISPELIPSLLPGHLLLEPAVAAAETGRFLVLSRPGGSALAINPHVQEEAPESLTTGRVYASEGRWITRSNRLIWTGHAPGMTLLVERPGQSDRIVVSLLSSAKAGINCFVNGRRAPADQTDFRPGQPSTVTIAIDSGLACDELVELVIAPVRLSTTARPERLEITGLSFQGN